MTTSDGQICTKKMGHGHWWSAASLIQYSLLNPGKTVTSEKNAQPIDEMNQKLKHLQPASKRVQFFSTTMPNCMRTTDTSKVEILGYEVLLHLPYSPDLSPTDYHVFKHLDNFLQGKCVQNQQNMENAFQEFVES